MAVPGTPQNFYVQSGDLQTYLSWDLLATATSYSVQRSTDGVTYAVVGTPAVNNYRDTSITKNTLYYYKVAGVNGSGTGAYTSAGTAIPTLSGQRALGELRLRAKQRADRENSNFVTLPEWNYFINAAYYELYDLLITTFEDYYVAPRLLITLTGAQSYDLPDGQNNSAAPALYKLYGVDLGLDSSTNAFVTLKKFDFMARNRYVYPQMGSTLLGVADLSYRMLGSKIYFTPSPAAGQYAGLWYFPRLTTLMADTDVMDGISGWEQYVIVRAAKYALDKEESDSSTCSEEISFLRTRIEESAANRDAGQPDTVSDTRSYNGSGYGYGPNGDGSYGGW